MSGLARDHPATGNEGYWCPSSSQTLEICSCWCSQCCEMWIRAQASTLPSSSLKFRVCVESSRTANTLQGFWGKIVTFPSCLQKRNNWLPNANLSSPTLQGGQAKMSQESKVRRNWAQNPTWILWRSHPVFPSVWLKIWKKDTFTDKSPCGLLTRHSSGYCGV